jgi:predicted PhzF superfamily epimerase YddE/YHI9
MSLERLEFFTVDVFAREIFGGSPLAIFFAAGQLRYQQMQ